MDDFGADRAVFLVGCQGCLARGAMAPLQHGRRVTGDMAGEVNLKLVQQADRLQVVPQGKTPTRQAPGSALELQMAYPGVVMVAQGHTRLVRPSLPDRIFSTTQQPSVGDQQQPWHKKKFLIEVNLQRGQYVLSSLELRKRIQAPTRRNVAHQGFICSNFVCH